MVLSIYSNKSSTDIFDSEVRVQDGLSESEIRKLVVDKAKTYIGVCEEGGDNKGELVRQFLNAKAPEGSAWCAGFASYVLSQIVDTKLDYSVLAKNISRDFADEGAFHRLGQYTPKPGDLIFFERGLRGDWSGHVGFVDRVDSDGTIHTIEGNKAHPDFKGVTSYDYDLERPDGVRSVAYSPEDFDEARIIGFGDLSKVVNDVVVRPQIPEFHIEKILPPAFQPPKN